MGYKGGSDQAGWRWLQILEMVREGGLVTELMDMTGAWKISQLRTGKRIIPNMETYMMFRALL